MTRTKNSNAIVVYKERPASGAQQNKKKNKKKKNGGSSSNKDIVAYRSALSTPFSLSAQGARVPDMFSCPTVTRHITRSITMSTNSNGDADMIILPNLFQHAISPRGSMVSEGSWATCDNVTVASGACTTATSALAAQLVNYRIVGYGVKIIGTQAESVASGKVHVATVPVSTWVNQISAPVGGQVTTRVDANQSSGATLLALGVPASSSGAGAVVQIGAIPSLPNSMETSVSQLNERPMAVLPKVTSPEAFNFRLTADSTVGFSTVDQTSASWVTAGDSSYLRIGGHEAVVVAVTGAVISNPVLEVEVVYHIEGIPFVVTGAGYIVAQDSTRAVVDPVGLSNVIQQVAKLPAFRAAVEMGGNMLIPGLGTLANRFY